MAKKKSSLEKIKEKSLEELKKAHNKLRVMTIVAYVAVFLSWFILKYSLIILIVAIAVVALSRIGIAIWLVKKTFPKKQKTT